MKFKFLIVFAFIAYVKVPTGINKVYDNVISWHKLGDMSIQLLLGDNRVVVVPAMFTVIEEKVK